MVAGHRLLWSIGLARREGALQHKVVTHLWFPVSVRSCLSLSITSFIFQFFFNLGLRSRASWWGRQPFHYTRSVGPGSAPKPGGTRADKAVKGLGMVPSPLNVPCISCCLLHLWLFPLLAWLCCLLPDAAWACCSRCFSVVICAVPHLCEFRSARLRAGLGTWADLPLHLPSQSAGKWKITQQCQMMSGAEQALL